MQVDPIKPTFKAPGSDRLELTSDILLATYALKLNLRHYNKVDVYGFSVFGKPWATVKAQKKQSVNRLEAKVRRCRLTR